MGVGLNATAKTEGASSELHGLGEPRAEHGVDVVAFLGQFPRAVLLLVERVPPLRRYVRVHVLLVVLLHLVDHALLHLVAARRVHRPVPIDSLVVRCGHIVSLSRCAHLLTGDAELARGSVSRFEDDHDLFLAELGTARCVEVVRALAHGLQSVLGRGNGQLLVLVLPRGQTHLEVVG